MDWDEWIAVCDWMIALACDGRMTDDFDYDWYDSWEWGDEPRRAVIAAIVQDGLDVV